MRSLVFGIIIAVVILAKTRTHFLLFRRVGKKGGIKASEDLQPALIYGAVIIRCCQATDIQQEILASLLQTTKMCLFR